MTRTHALTSPIKRIGFLVLVAGILVSAYGIFTVASGYSPSFKTWADALTLGYGSRRYRAVPWGFAITLTGLLFSFAYDYTIKRVIDWVRMAR